MWIVHYSQPDKCWHIITEQRRIYRTTTLNEQAIAMMCDAPFESEHYDWAQAATATVQRSLREKAIARNRETRRG